MIICRGFEIYVRSQRFKYILCQIINTTKRLLFYRETDSGSERPRMSTCQSQPWPQSSANTILTHISSWITLYGTKIPHYLCVAEHYELLWRKNWGWKCAAATNARGTINREIVKQQREHGITHMLTKEKS